MFTKFMSDAVMTVGCSSWKVLLSRWRISLVRDPSPYPLSREYLPESVPLLECRGESLLRAFDDALDKCEKQDAIAVKEFTQTSTRSLAVLMSKPVLCSTHTNFDKF